MKYLPLFLLFSFSFSQQSRIELKSHYSSTLLTTKEYNILFPEGYDSETDFYPVVYLFRGAVDEWADPNEDASRKGNIKTVVDSLYAKKKIGKMIFIMPGLEAPATENEYSYLVNELIPYIDAHYRTISGRWHRAMDGFSLGGLTVTNLISGAPHLFVSAGSYDGTLSMFENTRFSNASSSIINSIKQIQLLYHTASIGGNNNSNNQTTFNILNSKGIFNSLPSFLLDQNAQHNWFFCDWHMAITLPLHWQKIQSAVNNLYLSFTTPFSGQTFSGIKQITWSRNTVPNTITTSLFYSRDNGKQWSQFYSTSSNDSSFQWNTVPLNDGTRYKIKIISIGDSLFGSSISNTFTINNPGNSAPDVEFVNLNKRDSVSGNYMLQWFAGDADGDPISISLEISYDAGSSWNSVASSLPNNGNYLLDSRRFANGNNVLFRMTGSDGILQTQENSPTVIIYNKRINLTNASFIHQTGASDATIFALGMSVDSLRSGNYYIEFKESGGKKSYSVFNNKGIEVVKDAIQLDGKTEGPLFDGFRLLVNDYTTPIVNSDSTRWIVGTSNLSGEIRLIDISTGTETITAIPFPSDYEIRMSNMIVDTSLSLFDAPAIPVHFLIWNSTLNRKTKFIFTELDGNGILSEFDELYLIEKDSLNVNILTWHVQFATNGTAINPANGDKFKIKIMKPLSKMDSYLFLYSPPLSVKNDNRLPFQFSLSQNYPNPFNPTTEINYQISESGLATISVFDVLGRVVTTLVNEKKEVGKYSLRWDATIFASGIYFYQLRSGNFVDSKKMILLK